MVTKKKEVLNLIDCNMVGSIPNELWMLSKLSTYVCVVCLGSLQSGLKPCPQTGRLHLAYNRLSGTLPTQIGSFVALRQLELSNNGTISGTIPTEIGLLTKMSK